MAIGQTKAATSPARNNAFTTVQGAHPRREPFDLSHEKKITFDFGQLIPTISMEMIPGDTFEIGQELGIRFQPMLAPVMHNARARTAIFFVPNRLLWEKIDQSGDDWETFMPGGVDGLNAATAPRWNVSSGVHGIGSLWDFLGFPTWTAANNFATQFPDAIQPLDFKKRAYNLVWNEWFRDETLQDEVDIETNEAILNVAWAPDYFTKALPFQQRGTAPAFPVSGMTSAVWPGTVFPVGTSTLSTQPSVSNAAGDNKIHLVTGTTPTEQANWVAAFNANTVDLSHATTFTLIDFRVAAVTQQLLELNARGGVRYTEFLQGVYGCHPKDERLQRPEFIGAISTPVMFSTIYQNSATDSQPTPIGTMAGAGAIADKNYLGKYTAVEHGYLIGITWVMPVPAYQQGIQKSDARVTRYDWFHPQFIGLSEQAVINQELYLGTDAANQTIFGYQPIYNEYRYERSTVHGLFQTDLAFWHLGRIFASRPALNSSFISMTPTELAELKRIFAVENQPGLIGVVGNAINALRPMPAIASPGLFKV